MTKKYLDKVYKTADPDTHRKIYNEWSPSYDTEMVSENGYAAPTRIAEGLHNVMDVMDAPILDFGCGTGLVGEGLHAHGYTNIDGADLAEDMIAQARAKSIYSTLHHLTLGQDLPFTKGQYRAITASGVISPGAGPASLIDTLADLLDTGGIFAFTLTDYALDAPDYVNGAANLENAGFRKQLEQSGPHLPGIKLNSMLYIYQKA